MDARNRAFVVHVTPYRIRIKIPHRRRQTAFFADLQRALAEHPDIISIHVNALVASVVVHCRHGFKIASVRHCFTDLELVLPVPNSAAGPARQIVSARRVGDRSENSICLVSLAVKLAIAIATKRLEVLVREWILEFALRALLRELDRKLMQSRRLEAPRALLVAAAG